jgi:HK97 family phage prohead protease
MPAENEQKPEVIESRPFPNEHSCRLREPGDFKDGSFRRTERNHNSKKYSVIMGKLKGEDSMTEQAYRYKKDTWDADDARAHCKSHDGSFEAASESKSEEPKDIERRTMIVADAEMRVAEGEQRKLTGYAAKYGKQTDLGFFKEKIASGAFDEALKNSDARALKNHDPNLLLGRESSGTLRLEANSIGLKFELDVPDTTTGRDTLEEVRRGDLDGCSFAFTVAEDEWKHTEGEPSERTIKKIGQLFDIAPCTYPAYQDTSVAARSLQAHPPEPDITEEKKEQHISEAEQCEFDRRYRKAKRIIARYKSDKS